jgi:hypothetical protein
LSNLRQLRSMDAKSHLNGESRSEPFEWGKSLGGGSGQGRSPALAGGGKGKGKARVDQVVKALSGKTVDGKKAKKKRAPPSWGASGEASGRPRPPPRPAVG